MSSAWSDRYTLCGVRRFIRSLGIDQVRVEKFTSDQVACISSPLRTMVSSSSLAANRYTGPVPTFSRYS